MSETLWRHKKRGTVYTVLFDAASLQCASAPEFETLFDDDHFVVYQNVRTSAVYVRPAPEFFDGRFERLPLTEDEVRLIRNTPWQVKTARQFAAELGVKRGAVQHARDGRTYRWVTASPAQQSNTEAG